LPRHTTAADSISGRETCCIIVRRDNRIGLMCGRTADRRARGPMVEEARYCVAAARPPFPPSHHHFREQQCVVEGIDDAGKRGAAFLAFEAVAFKSACVYVRRAVAMKREPRVASGASDDLCSRDNR
jgi:hypothetical protein